MYMHTHAPQITSDGRYEVALPHPCNEWDIAYGTKEECIEKLKECIAEATDTLKKLEALP